MVVFAVVRVVNEDVSVTIPVGKGPFDGLSVEPRRLALDAAAFEADAALELAAAAPEVALELAAARAEDTALEAEFFAPAAFEEAAATSEEADFAAADTLEAGVTGMGITGVTLTPALEVICDAAAPAVEAAPAAFWEAEAAMALFLVDREAERVLSLLSTLALWAAPGKEDFVTAGGGATTIGERVSRPVGTEAVEGR